MVGASGLSTHTPWLDRYSTPDAQVLLEALPRGPKAAAQRVRTFFMEGQGAAEQVIWQGVWKWTLCYCTHPKTQLDEDPDGNSGCSEPTEDSQPVAQVAGHGDPEMKGGQNSRLSRPQTRQTAEEKAVWMSRECGAFLIPDPKRVRLCVPITHALALKCEEVARRHHKTALVPLDDYLVAIASCIAKSPETDGKRWPVWELETVAQTKAILGFIFSSPQLQKAH